MADRFDDRELTHEESLTGLPESFRRTRVILRGDDHGATMIMVSPPLVADSDVLAELLHGLDEMLTDVEKVIQP
jgi:adenosylmethionine-8-amino-7-oxononanoate aminotransferase